MPEESIRPTSQLYDLTGQVAIVTGAGQGLGFGITNRLAEAGAAVVIFDVNPERAASAVERLQKPGRRLTSAVGDVSKRDDVKRMLDITIETYGRVDILINNAGVYPRYSFLEMTEEQWDQVLAVNLRGVFLCSQVISQQMIAQGHGGKIVNISSGAGLRPTQSALIAYSTSKAGLFIFSQVLARSLARHQIRVNTIAPGYMETEGNQPGPIGSASNVPLGRRGLPDDVGRAVLFLVSDMAEYITGITLPVEGGAMLK